jgi:hypothetical protein
LSVKAVAIGGKKGRLLWMYNNLLNGYGQAVESNRGQCPLLSSLQNTTRLKIATRASADLRTMPAYSI